MTTIRKPVFQPPACPQIVRDWNARARRINRERMAIAADHLSTATSPSQAMAMDLSELALPTTGPVPEDVTQAWVEYVTAYNAEVDRYNGEVRTVNTKRQARRNTAEVTKVRQAACPRCFSTHPGEC